MQKYYICPECRGHLKVGEHIVFTAKNEKGELTDEEAKELEKGGYTVTAEGEEKKSDEEKLNEEQEEAKKDLIKEGVE